MLVRFVKFDFDAVHLAGRDHAERGCIFPPLQFFPSSRGKPKTDSQPHDRRPNQSEKPFHPTEIFTIEDCIDWQNDGNSRSEDWKQRDPTPKGFG